MGPSYGGMRCCFGEGLGRRRKQRCALMVKFNLFRYQQ